jgi:transposase
MPERPRNPLERELESKQKAVTLGELASQRRDDVAFQLWTGGMTQKEIAERLDRADRAAGGAGVSHGMVQKSLYRMRKVREAELVAASTNHRRRR